MVTYRLTDTQATLLTSLQFIAAPGQGRSGALAPVADYRLHGYGLVLLWAMLLASRPPALLRKLLWGTGVMLVLASVAVALQWLNDVFLRSGAHVLAQTRAPGWLVEAVAFGFHCAGARAVVGADEPCVCAGLVESGDQCAAPGTWQGHRTRNAVAQSGCAEPR